LDIGSAVSRALGITEVELSELASYRASSAFTERERVAVELAEAMTMTPTDVSASLRRRLTDTFTPAQVMELVAEIAWENHRARVNRALGVEAMGFSDGAFCLIPEHARRS
jgi:alkylhydroperoxidase family enzyme